jgi:hypothetical protein
VPGSTVGAEDSYERTMEHLMKNYEAEMSNPLKGLMFGSMMTAMLIQVLQLLLLVGECKWSGALYADAKAEDAHGSCDPLDGQGKIWSDTVSGASCAECKCVGR